MTFWESVISTSIGAFIGFLGALMIFFIKEKRVSTQRKKSTTGNLKLEIQYNLLLFQKFEGQFQDCIEAISNKSRDVFLNLAYDFVFLQFAQQFYAEGLLLKYFHPEDMYQWNNMLSHFDEGAAKYVSQCVDKWREGDDIDQNTVFKALKDEKKWVEHAKKMSVYILNKLP